MFVMNAGLTSVIGHKYLYERGVLHRDISPGNILIKWRPGSEADQPSTSGCLIDLDHAKKGKPSSDMFAQSNAAPDDIDVVLLWCSKRKVEAKTAHRALVFFQMEKESTPQVLTYLNAALRHASKFRPFTEQLCTPQHLRWKPVWPQPSPFPLL